MRNALSHLLQGVVVLTALALAAAAQDLTPKFEEYLNGLAKQNTFSGSVLVARDGKILYSRGVGKANEELDVPNTAQTKFRLGSVTKQFTSASIMLLEERGKLRVTDPICNYLSGCPDAWKELTIHHLLTHTSGIPNYTALPDYGPGMHAPITNDSLIARFKDRPLDFKPMEKWNYSNSGYFLLGVIIEKVSGETYETFLRKNIFEPLGMKDSGYDHFETLLKNRATGYSLQKGVRGNSTYLDMSQPGAAGALYSTVEDLFRWNEALYNGKLVSMKSLEKMTTPVLNNYGYALGTATTFKRKNWSHGGGINGFNTILVRYPAENATIVVLRNQDYGAPAPGRIASDLAAILFGEKNVAPAIVKVDPKIYADYVGEYELAPNLTLAISRQGDRLLARAPGQPEIELFPTSETKFILKVVDAQVTFVKDASGKVTHLILNQGGEMTAKKIK